MLFSSDFGHRSQCMSCHNPLWNHAWEHLGLFCIFLEHQGKTSLSQLVKCIYFHPFKEVSTSCHVGGVFKEPCSCSICMFISNMQCALQPHGGCCCCCAHRLIFLALQNCEFGCICCIKASKVPQQM